jgi:hypothetical protein
MLRALQKSGLDILIFRGSRDAISCKKPLPLFYGPVSSVEDWLTRARIVERTMRRAHRKRVKVKTTEKDWKWYNVITCPTFWF